MVAIVGVGQTKFDEHWGKSLRDLALEAGINALNDAGISGKEIEALFIGNMASGRFVGQDHLAALVADQVGLKPIPSVKCEAACASGSVAFRQAYFSILSGKYDIVVTAGAEKMTDIRGSETLTALMGAGDHEWEASIGLTFSGLYALMARRHMYEFGTTREQLALFSMNNHKNAVLNEYAQFPFEITMEDVLNSALIADPLRLLDCSPISDGAAAIVMVSDKIANRFDEPVWVLGCEQASDSLALHDRKSLTETKATKLASKQLYKKTGILPNKIELVEVHDCFSINGILALEDLGFCEKGSGGKFVEQGNIQRGGPVSVNTDGGLKAKGHPVGATGVSQIIEIVNQLRDKAGKRQVDVDYGLAHNVGGSGATVVVTLLGREKP